jgi:L-fuconolactonase
MFSLGRETGFVAGIVAWADLQSPEKLSHSLDKLEKEPKFVGIRHILEDEPDVNWIVGEEVLESLRELARRKIPYDMLARPPHLKNVLRVIEQIPELPVVIDHIAKPSIAEGSDPLWQEHIAAIADHSGVYCKLSGLVTEASWDRWSTEGLRPFANHALEFFGTDRVMYGSDWPVCLLAADSYQQVWNTANELLKDLSQEDQDRVLGGNAIEFYNLGTQREPRKVQS